VDTFDLSEGAWDLSLYRHRSCIVGDYGDSSKVLRMKSIFLASSTRIGGFNRGNGFILRGYYPQLASSTDFSNFWWGATAGLSLKGCPTSRIHSLSEALAQYRGGRARKMHIAIHIIAFIHRLGNSHRSFPRIPEDGPSRMTPLLHT